MPTLRQVRQIAPPPLLPTHAMVAIQRILITAKSGGIHGRRNNRRNTFIGVKVLEIDGLNRNENIQIVNALFLPMSLLWQCFFRKNITRTFGSKDQLIV